MTDEMPELDFSNARRGAVISEPGKERITIRLDADVLAWFRAQVKGGGNYQTLINYTLRAAMNADDAPLTASKLREILRQELHAA
jgi:uncharacterized protein (DUF4415 family)